MSAAASLSFPENFRTDTDYFAEALKIFLRQTGYTPNFSFADLTAQDQKVVLHLAQSLKREAQK